MKRASPAFTSHRNIYSRFLRYGRILKRISQDVPRGSQLFLPQLGQILTKTKTMVPSLELGLIPRSSPKFAAFTTSRFKSFLQSTTSATFHTFLNRTSNGSKRYMPAKLSPAASLDVFKGQKRSQRKGPVTSMSRLTSLDSIVMNRHVLLQVLGAFEQQRSFENIQKPIIRTSPSRYHNFALQLKRTSTSS